MKVLPRMIVASFPFLLVATTSGALGDAIEDARGLLRNSECVSAWDTLWPLIKGGNSEASSVALAAMVGGFVPPLPIEDEANFREAYIFFAVQAISFNDSPLDEFNRLRQQVLELAWPKNDPNRLRCTELQTPDSCKAIAIESGIAPNLATFSTGIAEAVRRGNNPFCKEDQY